MSVPHHATSPKPAANDAGIAAAQRREPGIVLRCDAEPAARHVGIVFVHGIGSQAEGETLLDWGSAIIRVLFDTRVRNHLSADPVTDVELDPGPAQRRWIELQVPAANVDGHDVPDQHWVMTEAWWAQRVRPPSFGQMAEWLGPRGVIRRILTALLPRRGTHDPRLRGWAEHHALRRNDAGGTEESVDPGPPDGMKRAPGAGPGRTVAGLGAGLFLQAVSALLLVLYGLLRSIEKLVPVGPLKDGALTRPLDRFVLEWFGDVYVLLSDTAQAASIRGQLVDAIEDLKAAGCDEIAIVAHSGGAIVSYMTLVDPSSAGLAVDRLITLGEGLNLAWRLTDSGGTTPLDELDVPPERLYGSLLATHPGLRWDDFWASQDPAPVGVLEPPAGDDPTADATLLARIQSHAIWNRLSFREDHGGYWDNDEEFLIPLMRLLAGGPGCRNRVRGRGRGPGPVEPASSTAVAALLLAPADGGRLAGGRRDVRRAGEAVAVRGHRSRIDGVQRRSGQRPGHRPAGLNPGHGPRGVAGRSASLPRRASGSLRRRSGWRRPTRW